MIKKIIKGSLQNVSQLSITDNDDIEITDFPIGGITGTQMVQALTSDYEGFYQEGATYLCTEGNSQYDKGKWYQFAGTSWIEVPVGENGGGFLSLERLGAYLYKATFDTIPDYVELNDSTPPVGACSSFIRDGKMYRSLDWNYSNLAEFKVVTKNFKGMGFISGMDDGALVAGKVAQLPYHLVDGRNSDGIMVSTHILFNDWEYAGSGEKNVDLTTIVYHVLNDLHDIDDIETVMTPYLSNIKIPTGLQNLGYVAQFMVSDGTTTYALLPPTSASGDWDITDISSNAKLTNFRWLDKTTVERDDSDLQLRPTGIERWNLIGNSTTLADLRFTLAYESTARLSEFIGIDDTTKESTNEELIAIYNKAHTAYETRTRDGTTWQSVHSVVYGTGEIEHLWVQENFDVDYGTVSAAGGPVPQVIIVGD